MADSFQDRFDRSVGKTDHGCWIWMKGLDSLGYGQFYCVKNGKETTERAHRASYEHFVGAIPDGLEIDHLCTIRCCVNPEHLEPVTHQENWRRSSQRGQQRLREKTHCPQGHPYTPDNLDAHALAHGRRLCVICRRERKRLYMRRRKYLGNNTAETRSKT